MAVKRIKTYTVVSCGNQQNYKPFIFSTNEEAVKKMNELCREYLSHAEEDSDIYKFISDDRAIVAVDGRYIRIDIYKTEFDLEIN